MYMKKLLLMLFLVALAPSVSAVPYLQLYSPDATWDPVTETYAISATDFELWVVVDATRLPLSDVTLVASIDDGLTPADHALSITDQSSQTTDFMVGDYVYGNPFTPPYKAFPANYAEYDVGTGTSGLPVPIADYRPGESDAGLGIVYVYQVRSYYESVHFDAYGFDMYGEQVRAPLSHDATAVPEPATFLMIGLGLAGIGIARRLRKSR
jgi:hypothetical protein